MENTIKNPKALIRVAEWLEDGAPHVVTKQGREIGNFDIEYGVTRYAFFSDDCGTACCIAGAVVQFEGLGNLKNGSMEFFYEEEDEDGVVLERGVFGLAKENLGISFEDANKLFLPWDHAGYEEYADFSYPKRAAKVIRHYIATGVVDWDRFDFNGNDISEEV